MSFLSKLLLKSSYKSAYGNSAIIKILDDTVEVVVGNRKIIHNKENSNKIEETFYDNNNVRVVKYNEKGGAELEELYIDGEKQTEKALGNGKSTNVELNDSGLETSKSRYFKDNVEYNETTYKFKNKITETDCTVILIETEEETLKNIVLKKDNTTLVDAQKRLDKDGRVTFYKLGDLEVEVEYAKESGKLVKRYSRHWEEPIYEEVPNKAKKPNKDGKEEPKKQVGVKLRKEILEYNENGKIVYLETDEECISKEYEADGALKRQYNIIQGELGKEIVGKIITEDKDIKIINNSTLPNDKIVKLNEEMDVLEFRYEDNLVMLYDFMFWDGGIVLTEEYYQINNKLDFKKRVYDKIENNVDYHIEETYKNNKIYAIRTTNKSSKTELYEEGNKRFIKGFSGVEKEITDEEYEVYKMADALNKI